MKLARNGSHDGFVPQSGINRGVASEEKPTLGSGAKGSYPLLVLGMVFPRACR
jgi:hypothetical protein